MRKDEVRSEVLQEEDAAVDVVDGRFWGGGAVEEFLHEDIPVELSLRRES